MSIVLFEIGFWEPISALWACHQTISKHDFFKLLIEKYASRLGTKMGSLYRDVVIACLSGDFKTGIEKPNTKDEKDQFYWAVVARLMSCTITDSSTELEYRSSFLGT